MKFTQVLTIRNLLTELAKIEAKQPTGVLAFPGDVRLKLCSILCDIEAAFEKYEKARVALVKQFGDEQPDKSLKVVDAAKSEAFAKEHEKLLEGEAKLKLDVLAAGDLAAANVPFALITAFVSAGLAKK